MSEVDPKCFLDWVWDARLTWSRSDGRLWDAELDWLRWDGLLDEVSGGMLPWLLGDWLVVAFLVDLV